MRHTRINILWLSDIHFRSIYSERALLEQKQRILAKTPKDPELIEQSYEKQKRRIPLLEKYLNLFIQTVDEYCLTASDGAPGFLDYIIITGDLAFASTVSDYQLLDEMIVQPLKSRFNRAKIITIPGNHDLYWKNAAMFDELVSDFIGTSYLSAEKNDRTLRNKLLRAADKDAELPFENYQDYFKKSILPTLTDVELRNGYADHGLYGSIVDIKSGIVFNLVNSSWFAIGQKFDNSLLDGYITRNLASLKKEFKDAKERKDDEEDKILIKELRKSLSKIVRAKNASQEYGEQVLGGFLLEKYGFFDEIKKYPGLFRVTAFHHPTNWLQYGEKYQIDRDAGELFIDKLMTNTQILLTGHEHVPSSVRHEKINDDVFHLKAGVFMQDDMLKHPVEQHRFSIIEIYPQSFRFSERKFVFDWDRMEWSYDESNSIKRKEARKANPKLTSEVITKIEDILKSADKVLRIFKDHFGDSTVDWNKSIKLEKVDIDNTSCNLFAIREDDQIRQFLIIPTGVDFFEKELSYLSEEGDWGHPFDSILKKILSLTNHPIITFMTADFWIHSDLLQRFLNLRGTDSPTEVHTRSEERADFIFNRFRYTLFSRYEKKAKTEVEGQLMAGIAVNGIEFGQIRKMRFSNQVVPFWIIERY